jgi:hypothetical protein
LEQKDEGTVSPLELFASHTPHPNQSLKRLIGRHSKYVSTIIANGNVVEVRQGIDDPMFSFIAD